MSNDIKEGVASENTTTEPMTVYFYPPEVKYCCPGYKLYLTEERGPGPERPQFPPGVAPWEWVDTPEYKAEYKEYIKKFQAFVAERPKCTCGNSQVYYGGDDDDGYCPACPEGSLSSVTATNLVSGVTSLYAECSQCGWRIMAGTC